jgi:Ca2+/H+ antiporter
MFIAAGVIISGSALNDGDCNWIEGVTFITVYVFFAVAFWFQ